METVHTITINIRTLPGMQQIGAFFLGPDADFAHSVFDSLEGDITLEEDAFIRIDLEAKEDGLLPTRLKSISCTLNQYADNCKAITRDVFKLFTLGK